MNQYDVIVLGGGAAGLMCAIVAGNRGRRVLVLEGANKIGKKILMSGGGRCNFTNLHCHPSRFLSANPRFCISALSRYTPSEFVTLVEQHNIAFHEKTAGQLFCDNSSKDIVAMLATECQRAGASIITDCKIDAVNSGEVYSVNTNRGTFEATALVVATGGLSIPKMGATDFGYRLARQFGLQVLATRAALVPLTFTGAMHDMMSRLSGISVDAKVSCNGTSFRENVLFTHRGLSGPAVLQISSYWAPGDAITLDLLPEHDAQALLRDAKNGQPKARLRTLLTDLLPRALVLELQASFWQSDADKPSAEFSDKQLRDIAGHLHNFALKPAATEGYRTAEVTLGGICTDELSSKTMECKRQPGLYCIGEVVDVTGHLGGFNFQWAWASAHAAGLDC